MRSFLCLDELLLLKNFDFTKMLAPTLLCCKEYSLHNKNYVTEQQRNDSMARMKKYLQRILCQRQKTVYEKCVLCGAETKVPTTTSIEEREDYIQGCGQLCARCRRQIHCDSPYIE